MKDNVDLTQNEMFVTPEDTHNNDPNFTDAEIIRMFSHRLPWNFIYSTRSINSDQDLFGKDELILTGTKKDRRRKSFDVEELTEHYCDCCGAYLMEKPWLRSIYYCLCQKCSRKLELEYHRIPWNPHKNNESPQKKIPWDLSQQMYL